MRYEDLGKVFGVSVSLKWGEAYSLFEELESAGRRDFVRGGTRSSGEVYREMMSAASDALLAEEPDYEVSVEEITNAVIYSSNTDVSRDEFRNNISEVLEDERRWEYFAGRSV